MEKIINPFIVTGRIPDAYFCDREAESSQLKRYQASSTEIDQCCAVGSEETAGV